MFSLTKQTEASTVYTILHVKKVHVATAMLEALNGNECNTLRFEVTRIYAVPMCSDDTFVQLIAVLRTREGRVI